MRTKQGEPGEEGKTRKRRSKYRMMSRYSTIDKSMPPSYHTYETGSRLDVVCNVFFVLLITVRSSLPKANGKCRHADTHRATIDYSNSNDTKSSDIFSKRNMTRSPNTKKRGPPTRKTKRHKNMNVNYCNTIQHQRVADATHPSALHAEAVRVVGVGRRRLGHKLDALQSGGGTVLRCCI